MKKVIGIPGYKYQDGSFGVGPNHLEYLSQFGNPRILMPWEEEASDIDLLYLPGGMDLSPTSYGEVPGYRTGNQDVFKQFFYDARLDGYIENGIPIFGVCLGMQMLAAKFGCKLTQNLLVHADSPDRWREGHKVYPSNKEGAVVGGKVFKAAMAVNSHHHQALLAGNMSSKIEPLFAAINDEFTSASPIIEAFKVKGRAIYGVQWHPEEFYDAFSKHIIESLLNVSKKEVVLVGEKDEIIYHV